MRSREACGMTMLFAMFYTLESVVPRKGRIVCHLYIEPRFGVIDAVFGSSSI